MSGSGPSVSRPHTSGQTPERHVDIGTPPDKLHVPVQNDIGASAISGAQYGQHKQHPNSH